MHATLLDLRMLGLRLVWGWQEFVLDLLGDCLEYVLSWLGLGMVLGWFGALLGLGMVLGWSGALTGLVRDRPGIGPGAVWGWSGIGLGLVLSWPVSRLGMIF